MINLLPNETKQQIRAARTNSILVKYIIILSFAVTFLVLASAATFLFLLNMEEIQKSSTKTSQSSVSQPSVNSQSTVARDILNQQVSYSNIIMGIAAALPPGVILDSLLLNDSTLGAPLTLQLHASSDDDVSKLKDSFTPPLFSNPSVGSATDDKSGPSGYPVKVTVSVTVNKGVAQ